MGPVCWVLRSISPLSGGGGGLVLPGGVGGVGGDGGGGNGSATIIASLSVLCGWVACVVGNELASVRARLLVATGLRIRP